MQRIEDLHHLFLMSRGISTDSRESQNGKIFIALRGDRFDGNHYAVQALSDGARAAIVDDARLRGVEGCYYVKNTLTTLQRLAYYHRKQFDIPVIGITGTNGKTTTKELITAVLEQHYQVCATKGNLNNHIGVPLTLMNIGSATQVAVVEMGANHAGEIGWLCHIAAPNVGLVTNVGDAHLEGFGNRENIWNTKMDLYRYLQVRSGTVLINEEEESLWALKSVDFPKSLRFHRGYVGKEGIIINFALRATTIEIRIEEEDKIHKSQAHLYGAHNIANLLSAIAVGIYCDVPIDKICTGITSYRANLNRSQIIEKDTNIFYLDAYNANPTSMKKALEFFAEVKAANKIAILGDMKELGPAAQTLHQEVIDILSTMDVHQLILVGEHFRNCVTDQLTRPVHHFSNADSLKAFIRQQKYRNTHFLVKGSRSIRLETIIQ